MSALSSWTDVGAIVRELDQDYEEVTPDQHFIAYQIVYGGKKHNVEMPKSSWDFAAFITSINLDHTRVGAPSLTVVFQDPTWEVLESGFFFADAKGKLLDLDVQYPDGDRYWWRLNQFSPNGTNREITLTFLSRGVTKLMGLFGPVQANRSSKTRAEFLKMLCGKVPEIEFYSKELDVKQPIGAVSNTTTKSSSKSKPKKAAKSKGLGANAGSVTAKGSPLNATQQHFVNLILQGCEQENAGQAVTEAMVFAGICESNLGLDMGWNSGNPTYGGLLAGSVQNFGSVGSNTSDAVATAQIKAFIHGGKGYNSALTLQSQYQDIGQLAAHVEGCVINGGYGPNGYGQYQAENPLQVIGEAQAIVKAGGGAGGTGSSASGTTQVAQPYYFQVQQNEDYWTAMCRLAQEVNWELVVDGDRIYFDTDQVFITQKPAAVIRRGDMTTLAWSYDWVNRQIATNFQVSVLCDDPFQFAAGEVFQMVDFGVAAEASTASPPLPGRWIIDEITRTKGDMFSVFTLVQPQPPKPEPAPQYVSASTSGSGASLGTTASLGDIAAATPRTAEAAYAAATYLAGLQLGYTQSNRTLKKTGYPKGSSNLDCSGSVSWVLLAAGFPLPGQVTWDGWAPVSGDYFGGGAGGALLSGPGKYMTIYANADHVFIRIHPQSGKDMQGNTVSPLVHMKGFDFFPWNTPGCGNYGGPGGTVGYQQTHYANT